MVGVGVKGVSEFILEEVKFGVEVKVPYDLAEMLSLNERSVRNALGLLDSLGLIKWNKKSPGKPLRPWWEVEVLDSNGIAVLISEDSEAVSL